MSVVRKKTNEHRMRGKEIVTWGRDSQRKDNKCCGCGFN